MSIFESDPFESDNTSYFTQNHYTYYNKSFGGCKLSIYKKHLKTLGKRLIVRFEVSRVMYRVPNIEVERTPYEKEWCYSKISYSRLPSGYLKNNLEVFIL